MSYPSLLEINNADVISGFFVGGPWNLVPGGFFIDPCEAALCFVMLEIWFVGRRLL